MCKCEKSISALVPKLVRKLRTPRGTAFNVVAVGFSKHGNLLGVEMNGWREMPAIRRGMGKHAEAALLKRFGKCIDTIYILRVGKGGDVLPIHPCESCASIAKKEGVKIVPIKELLEI